MRHCEVERILFVCLFSFCFSMTVGVMWEYASWTLANTGDVYEGGKAYEIEAPIETLPIFLRDGKQGYLVGEI